MQWSIALLGLCGAAGLRADVTIRYQTEFKPAGALQPFMEQIMKTAQGGGTEVSVQMKGNRGYTTAGKWIEVFDFTSGNVTLLDPEHKTFATLPLTQLGDKMANALPQSSNSQTESVRKAMESIKANVSSKLTGNTTEVQGVQAEERELTMTMDMPMLNQSGGAGMKLVMHIWTAKKEEALRVPAIRELTGYYAWQRYVLNPAAMLQKMAGKMPGMADSLGPMLEEIFKNQAVILRTQVEMYMPFLATMMKQMAAKGQAPIEIDPNAPILAMTQEAKELSSAPVDASIFDIPKDFTEASADDMVRGLLKAQQNAAAAPKAASPN